MASAMSPGSVRAVAGLPPSAGIDSMLLLGEEYAYTNLPSGDHPTGDKSSLLRSVADLSINEITQSPCCV